MFDAHGTYIAPEALPADIQPIDGVRVIVLHPARGHFSWTNGQVYEQMEPTLNLERLLTQEEAARWLACTQTARESDLMAANPE